jgi:radical SAM superfamily enzyme YgiQ (UPF0313 family)/ribosomal protein S18 acetylase RimI-like enzyme
VPHVTFIYPSVGRFPHTRYVRSWQMQPLAIAALSGLTPQEWDRSFQDDRLERLDYESTTDLAAISVESFTARRAYQISGELRARGVPVVLGGYHPTFMPQEAADHADAVCIGEAEPVWAEILTDAQRSRLAPTYTGERIAAIPTPVYDRSIFAGKRYFRIALVEAGRGCRYNCAFCSITAFHNARHSHRPAADVAREIASLSEKTVFLVDDNIVADLEYSRSLFAAIRPLGIRWVGQASVNVAGDAAMLDLMRDSGCAGLLIGFESADSRALAYVNKSVNRSVDYSAALRALRDRGIVVYGTFILGLPTDTPQTATSAIAFARREKLFMAAFNHLVPFPGTPLYAEMEREGKLTRQAWWLSSSYRFGDPPFTPASSTPEELRNQCHEARRRFFSLGSIVCRGMDLRANCSSPTRAGMFILLNMMLRREITLKQGLPLGLQDAGSRDEDDHRKQRDPHPDGARPAALRPLRRPRVDLRLAVPADDADLRRLMAEMPMPGLVEVTYRREPSFFSAQCVEGRDTQTIIGHDVDTGEVAGMGSRSLKPAFVNGQPTTIGYLSSLRVRPAYRGSVHLARGYEMMRQLHEEGGARFYLSTVLHDNRAALALTRRRARLPVYHDIGQIRTVAISLRARPAMQPSPELAIRRARREELPQVVAFLRHEGPRRQFFPRYREEDFATDCGLLRGLEPEHILLAFRGSRLAGVVAAWDQRPFRQTMVSGYPKAVHLARPLLNLWSRWRGLPELPPTCSLLNGCYLALVCICDDDTSVFGSLLQCLMDQQRGSHDFILAGMHERDPLFASLSRYRRLEMLSRLYVVCWPDGQESFSGLDQRAPYVELGAL